MIIAVHPIPVRSIPPAYFGAAEGIAYSHDGSLLAVAELTRHRVTILGAAETTLGGPDILAPHDVAFSADDSLVAVANRGNSTVTLHARTEHGVYSSSPVRTLRKPGWVGVTAVTFTKDLVVAAAHDHSVTAFTFDGAVVWSLEGSECELALPDGLAFNSNESLLAIANNLGHSITLYARKGAGDGYARAPVARLSGMRHPHSMAFTSDDREIVVTNSGGPSVMVFRRQNGAWGPQPVLEWPACEYEVFEAAHQTAFIASGRRIACEGGAKGIALYGDRIAWSGPNIGLQEHRVDQTCV